MLAEVPVWRLIARLPHVRLSPSRRRLRTHRTNLGELRRLLASYGVVVERRRRGLPREGQLALLRLAHPIGRGWHWAVASAGQVLDPARTTVVTVASLQKRIGVARCAWYPVHR